MTQTKIFLRNDDVNTLDPLLKEFWQIVMQEDACADMAVEPANVTHETVNWLKKTKSSNPDRMSIITHGYDHIDRVPGMGEFGGRMYKDQLKDIQAGRKLMDDYFGKDFFPAFTCPRGGHNWSTIRCMDEMRYKVFSSYHNVYFKNKVLYSIGRMFRQTHLLNKRVSWHTRRIPRTNLFDISMSMSMIKHYYNDEECEFCSFDHLKERLDIIRRTGQKIIGVTVHHRYHKTPQDMQLIQKTIQMFKNDDCQFTTIERIFKELSA